MISEISKYTKIIRESNFFKNISILLIGTLIAQCLQVIVSPYLTRVYSPSAFGEFSFYFSVVSVFSVIITGRYEYVILMQNVKKMANDGLVLTLCIVAIGSLILILLFQLINICAWYFDVSFKSELLDLLQNLSIIVVVNSAFVGIFQSLSFYLNFDKQYKIIGFNRILLSSITIIIQVLFYKYNFWGLVLGNLISYIVVSAYSLFLVKENFFNYKWNKFKLIAIARRHIDLPLVNGTHSLINVLKDYVLNLFLITNYDKTTLGFYYLMFRIMRLPVSLIGGAVSQVLLKDVAENMMAGQLSKKVKETILILSVLGLFPSLIMYFYGEVIFKFVFGSQWADAGKMAETSALYIFGHFVASPLAGIPIVLNLQKKAFWWGFIESILFIITFYLTYSLGYSLLESLEILSFIFICFFGIYINWILKICKPYN